jgi:hypothetical protein
MLVAGCNVFLVEDQDVEMAPREGIVRGDLRRDGSNRGFGIRVRGFADALKEDERKEPSVFADFEFLRSKIRDRPSRGVHDPHVEAYEVDARLERWRLLLPVNNTAEDAENCNKQQADRHAQPPETFR